MTKSSEFANLTKMVFVYKFSGDFSNCSKHIKQCQAGESFGSEVINENIPHFICDICHKRFKSKIGIQQHVVKCSKTTREQRKLQLAMAMAEEAA